MGAYLRKKFTPLQTISLKQRGSVGTSLEEELGAGLTAMGYLRQKNDPELMRMIITYATIAGKLKVASVIKEKQLLAKEFQTVSNKLFKHAHSINAFNDTRVYASSVLQSLDYLIASPDGEFAPLAKEVLLQLDNISSYGAPTSGTNTFFNPWLILVILLTLNFRR